MTVTRQDLEAHLKRLEAHVKDPRAGLYGPDSKLWLFNREAFLFVGGARAALLQTAHPFVAHAVDQHSKTKTDPAGRFQRTFANVFAMAFGDLESALKSARRVHAIHERIVGKVTERVGAFDKNTPYEANNEEALLWVHATLWDTSMLLYERLFRTATKAEKDAYYEETKLFAYLFGIPDAVLPKSWDDFMAYNQKMWESDVLTVGKPAREIAGFLLAPPRALMSPAMSWYKVITAGLLPERIRFQYGLEFGRFEEEVFERSMDALSLLARATPPRLRYFPAYLDARRRLAGKEGPDRLGQLLDKALVFGLKGNREKTLKRKAA